MNSIEKTINKKVAICIIARLESNRLPEKVLKKIKNQTIIEHIIHKLKKIFLNNIELVLCTTNQRSDDKLEDIARINNIHIIRGSVLSVADRMIEAAKLTDADIVVRVTGDNIFTDEKLLKNLLNEHIIEEAEYSRIENIPIGVTAEVINITTLIRCFQENNKEESEYMTLHLYQPEKYKVLVLISEDSYSDINLSVDTMNDFVRTEHIFRYLKENYLIKDVIDIVRENEIPYSEVDENSSVKLIDKVMKYDEYKKYLLTLREKSITKSIVI